MAEEWASSSSIPGAASPPAPDATRIHQDTFRAQGNASYYFELRHGDDSFGARAELGDAMPSTPAYEWLQFRAGEERWLAVQYYISPDWPSDFMWQTILQIKPVTPGGGGPSIGLDAGRGELLFYGNSNAWGSAQGNIFDGTGPLNGNGGWPLPKGRWFRLTYHVKFSADPSVGFVEVFGDLGDGQGMRTLAPVRHRATMKYNGSVMDPAHLRVGIYRDPAVLGTSRLWCDGITVATDRASAEQVAFTP